MILNRSLKEVNKLALTDENKDLIDIHKKKVVEGNFIMKAFKSQQRKEAGIESSEQEISLDDNIYYN